MSATLDQVGKLITSIKSAVLGQSQSRLQRIVSIVGALVLLKTGFKILKNILHLLRSTPDITRRYGKGSYVLITGSTDGIGKALTYEFAKRGFNIVSMSRSLDKLEQTKKDIHERYPNTKVVNIQADFSRSCEKDYLAPIVAQTEDLDISILINNVGIDCIELFYEMSEDFIHRMLSINVYTCTMLTRMLLPRLAERKRSAVITLGSLAGQMPMSYFNVYNATKAFTQMFSLTLAKEHSNIDFLSIRPSEVSTGMTKNKPTDIFTITAP
jgi:17beta-estradiol 17-dehydrogenase / very-long-chain 3-oxoacyl-CoA reductase